MLLRILSLIFILTLTGCAQQAKQPVQAPQTKPAQKAPATTKAPEKKAYTHVAPAGNWQAEGRIAAANGNKGGNANFVWTQKGDSYQIKLFGPFAAGTVYITGHPTFVELREANGKTTRAQTPEELLKKVAGWQVPLSGLRYWLRGAPSPKIQVSAQQEDNTGRLKQLTQQGWQVNYENYQEALPSKLRLQNGNVKVKMIVTQWKAL